MEKFKLDGEEISYQLSKQAIHIKNDASLEKVLAKASSAEVIAKGVKEKYQAKYGAPLNVSDKSVAIEIYGHVFPEKIAETLKKVPSPGFVKEGLDKVLMRTDMIDCGEDQIDSNRKLWDAIAALS